MSEVNEVVLPIMSESNRCAWAQYTIRTTKRDFLSDALLDVGIPTAVHYPIPLNRQPAVADNNSLLPVGDKASKEVLSLPMHPYLSFADVESICFEIKKVLK